MLEKRRDPILCSRVFEMGVNRFPDPNGMVFIFIHTLLHKRATGPIGGPLNIMQNTTTMCVIRNRMKREWFGRLEIQGRFVLLKRVADPIGVWPVKDGKIAGSKESTTTNRIKRCGVISSEKLL